ncbi:MAG: FtsW/RodA/SpoVE family cell cycle protein, partial [Bacteroidaceae bacterium]|nr:FtsW/RodA/SpoVE family cell cycle protein [Bacteroidaceae bacterium]
VGIYISTASYRAGRIDAWLHPENYTTGTGFQTLQGLYAIGSGGLFGKGLGESMQKYIVPEAQNDMIFSIICEELGIFGAVCLILMYILLLYRLLYIANHARDMFGSYICMGIMIHIALQVILNLAVVTNSMPNTGVTLPLVSYGGTSVSVLLTEFGLALSVSKNMEFEKDELDV